MIQLLAPLSLIDTSKTATGLSLKDLNRLMRQAHCEASDKLHYHVISDPVFVSFTDASWATEKISVLNVDISVSEQRGHCWTGVLHPVFLFLGTLAGVPELHVHPVLLRLKRQRKHKKRPSYATLVTGNSARRS